MPEPKQKKTNLQKKIIAIATLTVIAAVVIYIYAAKNHNTSVVESSGNTVSLSGRPLPDISTAQKRIASYTPQNGDIKYRIAQQPLIAAATSTPGWNLYTSNEYGFTFIFPSAAKILDNTEALGYQLPPSQNYKGSRDSFQIIMQGKNNAVFLLFMNDPDFGVASTTVTASSTLTISGLKATKQILKSTDPAFSASQIIVYSFAEDNHKFIWYGTFDAKDYESINEFQSIAESTKFN